MNMSDTIFGAFAGLSGGALELYLKGQTLLGINFSAADLKTYISGFLLAIIGVIGKKVAEYLWDKYIKKPQHGNTEMVQPDKKTS